MNYTIPDDVADDVDEEWELEEGQTGLDCEKVDVDGIGWSFVDVVLI